MASGDDLVCAVYFLAPWGASLGLAGAFFAYPALTEAFKDQFNPFASGGDDAASSGGKWTKAAPGERPTKE